MRIIRTAIPVGRATNFTGQRFGTITLTHRIRSVHTNALWSYVCDCGHIGSAYSNQLRPDRTCPRHYRVEAVSYVGAHSRVQRARGKASRHLCIDCGEQGAEWSYTGGDPEEMTQVLKGSELRYSANPRFFVSRCVRCHRRHDAVVRNHRRLSA